VGRLVLRDLRAGGRGVLVHRPCQPETINWLQALGASAAAVGGPIFLALLVAGLGHTMRLFALFAANQAREN
jgi:hypothetical protein